MSAWFFDDLNKAQKIEIELEDKIKSSGYTVSNTRTLGLCAAYDLLVTSNKGAQAKIEVKHDEMSSKTGNIAIELFRSIEGIKYNSGLTATKATHYIYKIRNKFYSISVDALKKLLRQLKDNNKLRITTGGDNGSVLALISEWSFRQACKVV